MINREDLLSGTRPEVGSRILVTEMSGFDGYEVMDYKGIAWGISLRTKDIAQEFFMGFKDLFGGELTSYTELLDEVRQKAMDRLLSMAKRMGANAVINFRFEQKQNAYSSNGEVIAYGNAVVIRPIKNYVPTGGLGNLIAEFVDAYMRDKGLSSPVEQKNVETGSALGLISEVNNFKYLCCPECGMKFKLQTDENGKNSIMGFFDEDDSEPGCQIHCIKCGKVFTIPNS